MVRTQTMVAQTWEATVYWRSMAHQLAEVPRRHEMSYSVQQFLMGTLGGVILAALLGVGLVCC